MAKTLYKEITNESFGDSYDIHNRLPRTREPMNTKYINSSTILDYDYAFMGDRNRKENKKKLSRITKASMRYKNAREETMYNFMSSYTDDSLNEEKS